MKLSVIILNYNQTEATLRCVESLDNAFVALGWNKDQVEIILIDNGSDNVIPDCSLNRFSTLSSYRLAENLGVARGRNYGLRKASGDLIMILDNDTIVNKDAVSRLVMYLTGSPHTGIVAPVLRNTDGSLQYSSREYPGIIEKIKSITGLGRHDVAAGCEEVMHPCYVIGACQLFRRDIIKHIGMLDENIFYGPEDADFCIRVSQAGYTIDYLTSVSIYHDHRRITRRNPFTGIAFRHFKALLYFYRKHGRWL